jgi:muramidase (phage lysozyme)
MDSRLKAFLDLIAWSEGTSTSALTKNDGYDVIVTGLDGPAIFTDYRCHPFELGGSVQWRLNPPAYSTAAGRYQLLAHYWRVYKVMLGLHDYTPQSQDAVALQQMKERGVTLTSLMANPIENSISACSNIWASFPGNGYKQHSRSIESLVQRHAELIRA